MNQRTVPHGAPVPRARQSYLFDQCEASGAYPPRPRFHLDLSDDRSIPTGARLVPPELDPDDRVDPDDPDSLESDPHAWPAWTDGHRYATDRGGAA